MSVLPDPFGPEIRGLDDPDHPHASLAAVAAPLVPVSLPHGTAWIVTDADLAREVVAHHGIIKDPAWAPAPWDARLGLEPTAAEHPGLTTLDGPPHRELRRAHAPLLTPRALRAHEAAVREAARTVLAEQAARVPRGDAVDLMDGFTTRYPLTVLLDLLGAPRELLDQAAATCAAMHEDDSPEHFPALLGSFFAIADAALSGDPGGLAVRLRDRLAAQGDDVDVRYQLFSLLFAGQLTTDPALGFALADALAPHRGAQQGADDLIEHTLREHPPAPFGLWRFTTEPIELGGVALPERAPMLIDLQRIGHDSEQAGWSFGIGPHTCIGAALARLELRVAVEVLREDHPGARLAVPRDELRVAQRRSTDGGRLERLPVVLDPV